MRIPALIMALLILDLEFSGCAHKPKADALSKILPAEVSEPMLDGQILSQCHGCSGWTMEQLSCGVPNPSYENPRAGKEVAGWHVEEDPNHTEYCLHAGGWMPSGEPIPICVLNAPPASQERRP